MGSVPPAPSRGLTQECAHFPCARGTGTLPSAVAQGLKGHRRWAKSRASWGACVSRLAKGHGQLPSRSQGGSAGRAAQPSLGRTQSASRTRPLCASEFSSSSSSGQLPFGAFTGNFVQRECWDYRGLAVQESAARARVLNAGVRLAHGLHREGLGAGQHRGFP